MLPRAFPIPFASSSASARRRLCLRAHSIFADWRDHCKPLPEETPWEACVHPLLVEHELNPFHYPIRQDSDIFTSSAFISSKTGTDTAAVNQSVADGDKAAPLQDCVRKQPEETSGVEGVLSFDSIADRTTSQSQSPDESSAVRAAEAAGSGICDHCHKLIPDGRKLRWVRP